LNVIVEDSLWNTTLQVIIMEGQLDVICNTGGIEQRAGGHWLWIIIVLSLLIT